MRSAVTVALYDQLRLPDFVCPGSICEYPPFASLGVTSTCQDVTSTTMANCSGGLPGEKCTFTTPRKLDLVAETRWSTYWAGMAYTRLNTAISGAFPSFQNGGIFEMAIVRLPASISGFNSDSWRSWKDGIQVYECTFSLCAKRYEAWSVINGTIIPGTETSFPFDLTSFGYHQEYTVTDPGFPHDRVFSINSLDFNDIFGVLSDTFKPAGPGTFSIIMPLYTSEDIPGKMMNVSRAMSYRMLSGPNSTETRGHVCDEQTFISVQWAWITLPAILVLAACGFLIVVIYRTHQAGQLVWKSSLTPILITETAWPLSMAGRGPLWTASKLEARTAVLANQLKK